MLNIRRVDLEVSHPHFRRVTVQPLKRIVVRHFSDGQHGGKHYTLDAAQSCQGTLTKTYPPLSKPAYCAIRKRTIGRASSASRE